MVEWLEVLMQIISKNGFISVAPNEAMVSSCTSTVAVPCLVAMAAMRDTFRRWMNTLNDPPPSTKLRVSEPTYLNPHQIVL